jgi:KUP system potassium uptake protein
MVHPGAQTYALVVLASLATVIASQALISGAFSMTKQATQLGFLPRFKVSHTAPEAEHQVYLPAVNALLAIACIALVLGFQASSRLASAYGIAVSGTMALTSLVFFEVARKRWKWPWYWAALVLVAFLSLDLPFLFANLLKIPDGGYVPLLVAATLIVVMRVWKRGQDLFNEEISTGYEDLEGFMAREVPKLQLRPEGTAVFVVRNANTVPVAMDRMLKAVPALQKNVLIVSVRIAHQPYVECVDGLQTTDLGHGFARVVLTFGFKQRMDVPERMAVAAKQLAMDVDPSSTTYYLRRETFLASRAGRMGPISEALFSALARNTRPLDAYFRIPHPQVCEIGTQIDL